MPKAVTPRFHDHERLLQRLLLVLLKDTHQFLMHGFDRGWLNAKIKDAGLGPTYEYQFPKIAVPCHQETVPLGGCAQQAPVIRRREAVL